MQVVGKRHRRARWRFLHDKGCDSCTAVLFILMEGGFFFSFILLHACIELTKCWMGRGTLTPGGLKRHELIGWMGGWEGGRGMGPLWATFPSDA